MRRPSLLEWTFIAAGLVILTGVVFILWLVGVVIDISLAAAGLA